MRLQKRTIQITFVITLVSCFLYAILIFAWNPQVDSLQDHAKIYLSNIIVGIIGSAIATFAVSLISYFRDERTTLEKFVKKQRKLFSCSARYPRHGTADEKVHWLEEYCDCETELFDTWAEIDFLIDPKKHKNYLKDICDYYNSLILLTGDELSIYEATGDLDQELISKLDAIIVRRDTQKRGITTCNNCYIRLTEDLRYEMNKIYSLYSSRFKVLFSKFSFEHSLVTKETFHILSAEGEEVLHVLKKEIERTGFAKVEINANEEAVNELYQKQYLSSVTKRANGEYEINCRFIVDHYDDLKVLFR